MASPVSSVTHTLPQAAVQPQVTRQSAPAPQPQPAAAPKPQPPVTDTVQISAAAKALQEAIETSAQTAHEAGAGDAQAQRLLAKEAAAHAVTK
jgi:hypothetical protein